MIFKNPPSWWHGKKLTQRTIAKALSPLSSLYKWGAQWDYNRRDSYHCKLPVICIGNFTAGGAGKTPTSITIIHMLHEMGEKPVILTRGYGGTIKGPYQVNLEKDSADDVGDEPLLLASHTAVVVSADRAAGAQAIEQGEGTIIVMDDGFQNNSLAKDLSLVVVDGKTGVGNGLVMPSGPLRSALAFQMPLADALVINGEGDAGQSVAKKAQKANIDAFLANIKVDPDKAAWLKGKKVIAFTGIGRPDKFYNSLKQCGAELIETKDFPDHHPFSQDEAAQLLEKVSKQDDTFLVTTQKDAMRLAKGKGALQWLRYETEVIPVSLQFEQADKMRDLLSKTLEIARKK